MITDPQTPDELEAALGLPVRRFIRSGVVPAGLTGDQLEHAVIVAFLGRPAAAGDKLTGRQYAEHREQHRSAWAALVLASLAAAPEAECPMSSSTATAVPAAAAGAA